MKILFIFPLFLLSGFSTAQNIQLHYDFGRLENGTKRNYLVSTFEVFRPDTLGLTFFFVDFEYNSPDKPHGVSLGYFEISRELTMPWFKNNNNLRQLAIHVEYNDGSTIFVIDSVTYGTNLRSAWLGGMGYPVKLGSFTLKTILLYKYIRGSSAPDFQLTFAWCQPMFRNKVILSGFLDIWTQDNFIGNPDNKKIIIYSEPQVWFNFYRKFSVGSEFKISKNFIFGSNRVEVFPTIGVKWQL
jgi:hypothetical protein